jgi:hypothetical protein
MDIMQKQQDDSANVLAEGINHQCTSSMKQVRIIGSTQSLLK